jgi:hypothetical protein
MGRGLLPVGSPRTNGRSAVGAKVLIRSMRGEPKVRLVSGVNTY